MAVATQEEIFNPIVDSHLPNGARVIDRVQRAHDGAWVWLADMGVSHVHRYVTWLSSSDEPGFTFWGHYKETLQDAMFDWVERSEPLIG